LFLAVGFGDHNNVAEIDVAGQAALFTFAPEEPAVLSGDALGGETGATTDGGGRNLEPFVFIGLAVVLVAGVAFFQRRSSRNRPPARRTPATAPRPVRSSR